MIRGPLFGDLPEAGKPVRPEAGEAVARMLRPERRQVALRAVDLDGLIPQDHPVRIVWDWVERQDLTGFHAAIKARGSVPGRPAIDPAILLALWLHALIEAVGSAREIERLCGRDLAYMWICGDVGVNYHALADFRVEHGELLDRLLAQSVAALQAEGLVQLVALAVDGVRVRAHAGSASFRRRERLENFERQAQERVARLKTQAGNGAEADKRRQAAAERAARERQERIARALGTLKQREAERVRRGRSNKKKTEGQGEVRASVTDPDARVMKMADGGFRPAYNVQAVTDPASGIIVATGIETTGSDRGLVSQAVRGAEQRYGRRPGVMLADGGYFAAHDIEALHALEPPVTAYVSLSASKHGGDPHAPRQGDGPGVAALRQRMRSEAAKAIYKKRGQAELPHARLRETGLAQFSLRGTAKVLSQAIWHALASNLILIIGFERRKQQATAR